MKQIASYYGQNNIRVNSISPGLIIGHVKGTKKDKIKYLKIILIKFHIKIVCQKIFLLQYCF